MEYDNCNENYVYSKQLSWYSTKNEGRMKVDIFHKEIFNWIPEGRRPRGKPVIWKSEISEIRKMLRNL